VLAGIINVFGAMMTGDEVKNGVIGLCDFLLVDRIFWYLTRQGTKFDWMNVNQYFDK
jgi:hypothetical protein